MKNLQATPEVAGRSLQHTCGRWLSVAVTSAEWPGQAGSGPGPAWGWPREATGLRALSRQREETAPSAPHVVVSQQTHQNLTGGASAGGHLPKSGRRARLRLHGTRGPG